MIKLDIINEVVNRTGITKTKAEMAVETVFESMKRALGRGERIELRGFGIFNVRPRKTGIGRNPRTGAEVAIPPAKPCGSSPARNCRRSSSVLRRLCRPTAIPRRRPQPSRSGGVVRRAGRGARSAAASLLAARAAVPADAAHHHHRGRGARAQLRRGPPFDFDADLDGYLRMWHDPAYLLDGLPFSLTLLAILLAHEMGHYLAARYYRVDATLPFFHSRADADRHLRGLHPHPLGDPFEAHSVRHRHRADRWRDSRC